MRSMRKKQKVFVQTTSEADERKACWVGLYSQSWPRGAKETSVSCFYFCRDLASASLVMKEPKGEETVQAKGHQRAWLCDLGRTWSKVALDPNCSLCRHCCFCSVNPAPKQWILLEMKKHRLRTFLLLSLPHLGQQQSFLILAIYISVKLLQNLSLQDILLCLILKEIMTVKKCCHGLQTCRMYFR